MVLHISSPETDMQTIWDVVSVIFFQWSVRSANLRNGTRTVCLSGFFSRWFNKRLFCFLHFTPNPRLQAAVVLQHRIETSLQWLQPYREPDQWLKIPCRPISAPWDARYTKVFAIVECKSAVESVKRLNARLLLSQLIDGIWCKNTSLFLLQSDKKSALFAVNNITTLLTFVLDYHVQGLSSSCLSALNCYLQINLETAEKKLTM